MTSSDDTPETGVAGAGRDERPADTGAIGADASTRGTGDPEAGPQQAFEREAAAGVEAAARDDAALEAEAAALREEAAELARRVSGTDAPG